MTLFWSRVECEAAVGSNVRSVPAMNGLDGQGNWARFIKRGSSNIFTIFLSEPWERDS